ncbi:phytanoyl-CoA dioxygenase family protein [Sphingomonas bacterium]|uniref:phytanoyl-CoA dioxygenase family protein n=1 Tax=Sphingomonas bacterium TaxID=1895847 RepID=UPI00266F34D5|nr:phytanoyl-CoA dioxygenase family protein [Sphingomonas bacterium]
MSHHASVTAEQICQYQIDGAVLIKRALDPGGIALLEQGVEEAYRAQDKRATKLDGEGGAETVVRDYATQHSPSLLALTNGGAVGRIAAGLMETASAQVILDQIFYKSRGPILPTPWHQDTPFLRVRGDPLVRLWFPCDFSPKALTVQVVRGSHRWNTVYNTGANADPEAGATRGVGDSWLPPAPDVRRYRESFDILSWDVEPGDAVAFQGNMLHGTDGHPGHDSPRRAFAILLGGPELRYHAPEGKAFPSPGRVRGLRADDAIPHGAKIGDYRDAFPICPT